MYFNNYSSKESDIIEGILNHDQMLELITEEQKGKDDEEKNRKKDEEQKDEEQLIQKRNEDQKGNEDHEKPSVDQKPHEEGLVC